MTSRLGLLTNELGLPGSRRFLVSGKSVVSITGVAAPIALNSETSSEKMCASIVSIAGPAGYHCSAGAGVARAKGKIGKRLSSVESGPGMLASENATANKIRRRMEAVYAFFMSEN